MRKADIRVLNGNPALFIDGKPASGFGFYCSPVGNSDQEIGLACRRMREFGDSGFHVYSFTLGLGDCWVAEDKLDFDRIDKVLAAVTAADPRALFLPRVIIDAPPWWRQKHPAEMSRGWDRKYDGFYNEERQCFSSETWRRDAGSALRGYLEYLETGKFADQFLGYLVCAGRSNEWSYGWYNIINEFSEPQIRGFRKWLRARYQDDARQLQSAWKDKTADFNNATIPAPERRLRGDIGAFFDPALSRHVPDYMEYHNEAVSDAVIHFAGIVKKATRRSRLCGVFYGYYFFHEGPCLLNVGHRTFKKVLECPDIDFIAAPHNYRERHQGGILLSQAVTGSIRLNGKLFYDEDDTRTWLCPPDSGWGRVDTMEGSLEILKRNFGAVMAEAGTLWWMEQTAGWFNHPAVLGLFARMEKLAQKLMARDRKCAAKIAVIVSDQSTYYMRHDASIAEPTIYAQMLEEMSRLGAPFDTYIADDLPDIPEYKLYIFLNTPFLTPSQREAIGNRILRAGHTVLWVYAPGFITGDGVSVEAMSELIGMNMAVAKTEARPRLAITDFDHPITRDLPRGTQFTPPEKIGPLFWCADTEAVALGEIFSMFALYKPGLAVKKIKGSGPGKDWNSVWCGVPGLPSSLLRGIARFAGVHIYADSDDAVYANHAMLTVHTRYAGERIIRLPKPANVTDAFTGQEVARGTKEFKVNLGRGCTGCWLLE